VIDVEGSMESSERLALVIIGTLYKEMRLRGSVLDEFKEQNGITGTVQPLYNIASEVLMGARALWLYCPVICVLTYLYLSSISALCPSLLSSPCSLPPAPCRATRSFWRTSLGAWG
jgi:hypothetical protein